MCMSVSYISGNALIINGMATVIVSTLECGATYTIIAGGTLNGNLVGPRSSYETISKPCLPQGRNKDDEGNY